MLSNLVMYYHDGLHGWIIYSRSTSSLHAADTMSELSADWARQTSQECCCLFLVMIGALGFSLGITLVIIGVVNPPVGSQRLVANSYYRKCDMLTRGFFNVGPAAATLAQH